MAPNDSHTASAPRRTLVGTAEDQHVPRPAFLPEEGQGGRSEWFTLVKAVIVVAVLITVLGSLFTR